MNTYGYDFCCAVAWSQINQGWADLGAGVTQNLTFASQNAPNSVSLTMSTGAWSIVAGGGNSLVHLSIPATAGSLQVSGEITETADLAGVVFVAEVSLTWLGDANSSTGSNGSGSQSSLVFAPAASATSDEAGYVSIVKVTAPSGALENISQTIVSDAVKGWLIANQKQIDLMFGEVMPSGALPNSWLTPTAWTYFNISPSSSDLPNALCFLCMVLGHPLPSTASFDATSLSSDYNTLMLISQPVLFQQTVLPAVQQTFPTGSFACQVADAEAKIVSTSSFTTDKIETDSYTAEAATSGNALEIDANGGGPLKFLFGLSDLPNANYTWTSKSTNPVTLQSNIVSFQPDPNPQYTNKQHVPAYDWALLAVVGIVDIAGLASDIYDELNDFGDKTKGMGVGAVNDMLAAAVGGNFLNLAGLMRWTIGNQTLTLKVAGMQGPLYLQGNFA